MGRKKRIWGLGVQCGGQRRVMGQMWGTSGRGSILSLLWQRPANCCLLCRHGNACTPPLLLLWQHLPIKPIAMATSPPPSSPVATATPANQTHRYGNQPSPLPPGCYGSTCQSNPSLRQPDSPTPWLLRQHLPIKVIAIATRSSHPWLLWQHLPIKPIAMATRPSHPLVATAAPANQTHRYGNQPFPLPPGCYGSTCQSNPSLWQPALPPLLSCCYGSTCQSNPSLWQPDLPTPWLLQQHLPIKPIAMATSPPRPPVAMAAPANQTHRRGNQPSPSPPWLLRQHLPIKPIAMATRILSLLLLP